MQWETEWWGVRLIAETEDDEALLRDLQSRLFPELGWIQRYEAGTLTSETDENTARLSLVFRV